MLKDGSTEEIVIGGDETLEITPPEPFLKGTPLPLKIQAIDLSPQPCPR
jgi:alpha-L-fucosidase